jgi:Domain of unknown function (DUF4112)
MLKYSTVMRNKNRGIEELRRMTIFLDTRFKGPFGTNFGIDALVGLIPGIGDVITSAISFYIITQAAALGVGASTLIRMSINLLFENLIDMVPLLGNIFDFYWKANRKNMELLEAHLSKPARETIKLRMIVGLVAVALIVILAASANLSWIVLSSIHGWILSRSD